jgi:hypothetical protein
VTSGSEASSDVSQYLASRALEGAAGATCAAWTSDIVRQDVTHLYGLEPLAQDRWAVDVLAKP